MTNFTVLRRRIRDIENYAIEVFGYEMKEGFDVQEDELRITTSTGAPKLEVRYKDFILYFGDGRQPMVVDRRKGTPCVDVYLDMAEEYEKDNIISYSRLITRISLQSREDLLSQVYKLLSGDRPFELIDRIASRISSKSR